VILKRYRPFLAALAALAALCAAVIGFIVTFATNPLVDWAWAFPCIGALIGAALVLHWVAMYEA
jgi:hypothetical protein